VYQIVNSLTRHFIKDLTILWTAAYRRPMVRVLVIAATRGGAARGLGSAVASSPCAYVTLVLAVPRVSPLVSLANICPVPLQEQAVRAALRWASEATAAHTARGVVRHAVRVGGWAEAMRAELRCGDYDAVIVSLDGGMRFVHRWRSWRLARLRRRGVPVLAVLPAGLRASRSSTT